MDNRKSKKLSPEKVMGILKKKGIHVDMEEARTILEFVEKIAHIAVNQYAWGGL